MNGAGPARAARDVKPGESWVFRDHRTIAEVDRDQAQQGGKDERDKQAAP